MIPKVIYYAWFGGTDEPTSLVNNKKTWSKYLPGYKIVRIDETNFDVNKYSFTKSAAAEKKWAFVSDLARYVVLFESGGIYLDTDVEIISSIDDLLIGHSFWALENSNSINSGLIFAVEKKDNNLKNIIGIYKDLVYTRSSESQVITTKIVTPYFTNQGFKKKNKLQRLFDGTIIYPTQYFAPYHWWGGGRIWGKTRTIHHYHASWGVKDKKKVKLSRLKSPYFEQEIMLISPTLFKCMSKAKKILKQTRGNHE
ncbi:glycosyltransferase family 32 protein [Latilactobacillus curvatus]|uniref:glycosyltransferase family 32 protein n=1 Tax=Latilactobacillus curvatus TaxID=28038 RepID=UPI00202E18B2|nr:glycosyltransferase [Latilactobacillus curvatus]MCM0725991.1 glycosyl transferase [Latilactobacillus curvatus]